MALLGQQLGKLFQLGKKESTNGALGIEIGASSVKVVQVTMSDEGVPTLETYGEIALGPYAGKEAGRAAIVPQPQLTAALTAIMTEAKVTTKRAALAIPYKASFVVNVSLPTRDPGKLASLVPIEARKYVPLPMNEVTLDWFVIPNAAEAVKKDGVGATPASGNSRVLLAAIHNETFAQYQAVTKAAGIGGNMVEIEAFSVLRSCLGEHDLHVMVFDYGASAVKMHIVDGGVVREVHHTNMGGEALTAALAESLKVGFADAEALKREHGVAPGATDARVRTALEPVADRALVAGKRVLDAYEQQGGTPIEKIILTGGGAQLAGLIERASEMFGRPVVRANPFDKVAYPPELEKTLSESGGSFSTAMGVALRRLYEA